MGYRNYIGYINKEEYNKIKDKTKQELNEYYRNEDWFEVYEDEEPYIPCYKLVECLYEFGKYVEFGDEKYYSPFFTDEKTQEYMTEEHDFFIVNKDFLKHIINHYKEKIQTFYKGMLLPEEYKNKEFKDIPEEYLIKWHDHIRFNSSEWIELNTFHLEKGDEITTSWKYEYSIFELVRIYKHFDWENNIVVYYGW